jgi:hypothetical protein
LVTFYLRYAIKAPPHGRQRRAKCHPGQEETAMGDANRVNGTYASAQFGAQPGERWRRFLERIGTRSNDFASRLARARFVYLHRRDAGSNWLPL